MKATHRKAPPRNVVKEATGKDGTLDSVKLMNIISPKGRRKSPRSVAAAQASRPARQQTLGDFEFSLGSKQTMQGALNELSADEISDMFRAMDTGEGVDVRSGRNRMAFDIMRMKRGLEAGGSVDETGALLPQRGARGSAARELLSQ